MPIRIAPGGEDLVIHERPHYTSRPDDRIERIAYLALTDEGHAVRLRDASEDFSQRVAAVKAGEANGTPW